MDKVHERKLTPAEVKDREDIIMTMKSNKRNLVKKYGKDAEAVMYGRATNMVKNKSESMKAKPNRLTELIKDSLKNPKKADLDKDGKLSDYEKTRGAAIEKNLKEKVVKGKDGDQYKKHDVSNLEEDLDLGHEDNEPHMLKADLYRIGKYSMELYNMVDKFDGKGEVDFPSWWQAKIFKAKDALVGAKHYLDFEINEPKIDAVVDTVDDITTDDDSFNVDDVVDLEIDENKNRISKVLEGLPKGFWDKKIDAKDEDQDGKIDEDLKGLMAQGEKIAAFANKQSGYEGGVSSPVRGVLAAMAAAGAPDFDGDDEMVSYYTRKLTKAIETQKGKKYMSGFSIDESYDNLVSKIKKQGKSAKAAKAIAGAVASYKAKGGGKGPTAKQK